METLCIQYTFNVVEFKQYSGNVICIQYTFNVVEFKQYSYIYTYTLFIREMKYTRRHSINAVKKYNYWLSNTCIHCDKFFASQKYDVKVENETLLISKQ